MPDILIRGMEMPRTCLDFRFLVVFHQKHTGICTAFGNGTNRENLKDRKNETGRMSGCPLHELPQHGDLIDRGEAIIDADERAYDFWTSDDEANGTQQFLKEQPVIVPAERREEDD